jgi:hypothetical protein
VHSKVVIRRLRNRNPITPATMYRRLGSLLLTKMITPGVAKRMVKISTMKYVRFAGWD